MSGSGSGDRHSIAEINALDRDAFVALLGPVFEETPEIAIATFPQRPFKDRDHLRRAMVGVMRSLPQAEQLALIRAHPDLGSKAKMAEASVAEQSAVGLDRLSREEFETLQRLNQNYQEKFGFPFILAVRAHNKDSILAAFQQRLNHSKVVEQATALEQIAEIARLRLERLIRSV